MSDRRPGQPQGRCETTLTPRYEPAECHCQTYEGNLGPCLTYEEGASGRCVYCDHTRACHDALFALAVRSRASALQDLVEVIATEMYNASPEYDIGETVDGFQVTPGGALSWPQFIESQPDLAEEMRLRARAAIAAMPPPPEREALRKIRDAINFAGISCVGGEVEDTLSGLNEALAGIDAILGEKADG